MNAADMRVNKMMVRREFWENRSLWIVPAVVVGLFLFTGIVRIIMMLTGHAAMGEDGGNEGFVLSGPDMANAEPGELAALLRVSPLFMALPFNFIMLIVVFFYLLDSLYADRRDRSVLFWRSMPVSDTRTVLVKLFTGMLAATAITLGAVITTQLITILLSLVTGNSLVQHPWLVLTHPVALVEGWLLLAYALVCQSIWFLPFYGWWMLASAWAKKAPLLWSVLPPVMIIVMEAIVFRSHHFANMVGHHFTDWMGLVFNFDLLRDGGNGRDLIMNGGLVDISGFGRFLASPELWIGTAVGAAFIYGAIRLRRVRSEI
jgi:ABC-2 type transport system permease protein